jgi:hypothetical protein
VLAEFRRKNAISATKQPTSPVMGGGNVMTASAAAAIAATNG